MAKEEQDLMDEHKESGGGLFHAFWKGPLPALPQWEEFPGGQRQVGYAAWRQRENQWRHTM